MEFDKSKVYTALNADELRAGDKVIVGDVLANIKENVKQGKFIRLLYRVENECNSCRFVIKDDDYDLNGETLNFALAYLVERKENCTNCELCERTNALDDEEYECSLQGYIGDKERAKTCKCLEWKPKPEMKDEPHYRPFKDTDELIKVWEKKWSDKTNGQKWHDCKLNMPLIWVRSKGADIKSLITGFKQIEDCNAEVFMANGLTIDTTALYAHWTFLDGSPCGVEE